jgi:outer membrane protein assembly factor BamE (lipoprotein component of BamABCDE complex)
MNHSAQYRELLPGRTAMRLVLLALLIAAVLGMFGWFSAAGAQAPRAVSSASRVQAERAAVDLRQGMTPDEVQQLLGKPWRTALAGNGNAPGQGTLRWTYTWIGSPNSSSSERVLNVEFNAKAAEQWTVSGWNWSAY